MINEQSTPADEADATTAVETPAKQDAKPDPKAEAVEQDGEDKATTEDDGEKDGEDKPRDKQGRFQKRVERLNSEISELTAAKRSTEREVAELLRRAEALRRDLSMKPQIDPADYELQDLHRVRTAVKAEKYQDTVEQVKQLQERAAAERYSTFIKKVEAAREIDPDLDEALEQFSALPVSDHAADIIAESDVAPQLAKYLARHPREAREIMGLPPHKQGLALARIEARLSSPAEMRKVSKAPAPVPTVGGSQPKASKSAADMSVDELSKWYAKQTRRA